MKGISAPIKGTPESPLSLSTQGGGRADRLQPRRGPSPGSDRAVTLISYLLQHRNYFLLFASPPGLWCSVIAAERRRAAGRRGTARGAMKSAQLVLEPNTARTVYLGAAAQLTAVS